MNDFELIAPNGTDINNEFLKQYRDALRSQYDANVSSLRQEKRNADAAIMSGANRAGLMYSNFPQRAKIQNEANYLKNMSNLHTTYQTGLDKLRGNAVDTYNKIKDLEDAIADLNETANSKNNTNTTFADQVTDALSGANKLGNNNTNDDVADNLKEQQEKLGITGSNTSNEPGFLENTGRSIASVIDQTSKHSIPASLTGGLGYVAGSMLGPGAAAVGTIAGQTLDMLRYGKRHGWW